MRSRTNLQVVSGDDRVLSLTARDQDTGAVVNLTGASAFTFKAAKRPGDDYLITKTAVVVSAAAGTYTVTLLAADTDEREGDLFYDVSVTLSGLIKTVNSGRLRILGDVT